MGDMRTIKVVDERGWKEFNRSVSSVYGSLRIRSFPVEEAIECFNTVELLKSFSKAIDLLPAHTRWSGTARRGA